MTDRVVVDDFTPKKIASGGHSTFELTYSAGKDGFIVVNESPQFDAMPGQIPIQKGKDLSVTARLKITRQPASAAKECLVTFTLGPSSFTVLIGVSK
jgi:hypothetical protein